MPTIVTEQPAADRHPAQGEPDRTDRYMRRLEGHLESLAPAARLIFLRNLKEWWIAEFERWATRVDNSTATATDLQCNAFDFRMTIDAVSKRHATEAAHAAVIPTESNHAEA